MSKLEKKRVTESIDVEITVEHYGFYHSDEHFGNEHKPYRDWVVKQGHDIGIKKWSDYHSGMWTTDVEMIDDWIEQTSQPYESLYSEKNDGIYIVNKNWRKNI
jgi:hypothetical protein